MFGDGDKMMLVGKEEVWRFEVLKRSTRLGTSWTLFSKNSRSSERQNQRRAVAAMLSLAEPKLI